MLVSATLQRKSIRHDQRPSIIKASKSEVLIRLLVYH